MKTSLLLLFALFLTGCAGQPGTGQRVALDTLATGVGGAAAYYGSNHDPSMTTAGAVGGFVVSEAFQTIARSGRQKAYNSGIQEGIAIGQEEILKGLWEESNGLPKNKKTYQNLNPVLTVPARNQNGVRYDSHTASTVTIKQPEKIQTPAVIAATNAVNQSHYESFQSRDKP